MSLEEHEYTKETGVGKRMLICVLSAIIYIAAFISSIKILTDYYLPNAIPTDYGTLITISGVSTLLSLIVCLVSLLKNGERSKIQSAAIAIASCITLAQITVNLWANFSHQLLPNYAVILMAATTLPSLILSFVSYKKEIDMTIDHRPVQSISPPIQQPVNPQTQLKSVVTYAYGATTSNKDAPEQPNSFCNP